MTPLVSTSASTLQESFTAPQLGRLLQVPEHHVRSWVRRGLLTPAAGAPEDEQRFDFSQLALARVLADLSHSGTSPQRLRKLIDRLRAWLPEPERVARQLGILGRDGELLVRLEDGALADTSGQLQLDFAPPPPPAPSAMRRVSSRRPRLHRPDMQEVRDLDADAWFERGLAAEDRGDLVRAEQAYCRALAADGGDATVRYNLGNVLYRAGRLPEAAQAFLGAVEADPAYVEAWSNLGLALHELEQWREAARAFRQALTVDADYAHAHLHLADTLEELGQGDAARRHRQAFLRLDPHAPQAPQVRRRLLGGPAQEA